MGPSLGAFPVANLVVLEVGLAIGLLIMAIEITLWPVSAGVLVIAMAIAFTRWRGRWVVEWTGLTLRYLARSHTRVAVPPPDADNGVPAPEEKTVTGPEDARVALLRLVLPDLVVAHAKDHERRPLGLAWHDGAWTAVLMVEPAPALVTHVGAAPNLPFGALAPCLEDRGVVLDSIQVIWHCYPGSASLPASSPALNSYLEVLGPLPAAARRSTLVAVRLDPRRCQNAVSERGGGVVGAHRALIGALSRVRNAMEGQGVPTRPLDVDELLRAGISTANLQSVAGAQVKVGLRERWAGVTAGGVGHASYAVTAWPSRAAHNLNALTGVRALSSTVTMSISPTVDEGQVSLRGLVRVSARTPSELAAAHTRLNQLSGKLGVTLTPLRGLQIPGLAATLPLGGTV
ncbi:type VII secretion protein EccE [Actinoalloteichus hymeniacidonis]|uniref:Type VII secretion protein EccE n=1 Tax=Actinoalloteichus hymeniacidonis TaxID=340345 RepID=A0AAC9N0M7_9PSEU|nr:type VII secretion protein EccE [Actinoalloteichus hymeniacidonis]AOS65774.1 type VII secretion protein EccE [Actinoalloteichus hymeniacidonis]MBB5906135.1 type VII secretion protein EccE [Actinoalloteichus hymeniacidonis]